MSLWNSLEQWRATAFLVAGIWLLFFVAYNGLQAFTSVGNSGFINALLTVPGLIAGYLGLFGFYPQLADRVRRQTIAGAIVVVIAAICALGMLLAYIITAIHPGFQLGANGPLEVLAFLLWLLMIFTTTLGFILFSIAILRTGVPSRTVGLALIGPPIVFILNIGTALLLGPPSPDWVVFIISGMQAGAHLAIGVVLRTETVPTDRAEPAPDSAAR